MKCPKYVKNALQRRAKYASEFLRCDQIVVEFLEKHNMLDEVENYDILTGCESLCNPDASSARVLEVIENKEK